MTYPRACALAEVAGSPKAERNGKTLLSGFVPASTGCGELDVPFFESSTDFNRPMEAFSDVAEVPDSRMGRDRILVRPGDYDVPLADPHGATVSKWNR